MPALAALAGCASSMVPQRTQHADSGITSVIQASLNANDKVKAREVDVETREGVVYLNGVVDTEEGRLEAARVACGKDFISPRPNAQYLALRWALEQARAGGAGRRRSTCFLYGSGRVTTGEHEAFGEHGEGYVRIAMVENEQRIRQAARGVRRFLESGIETLHNVVPLANRR